MACGKVVLKPLVASWGGSNELWFFMTQHRKNSSRGKVTIRSDLLEQDAEEAQEPNFQRVPCPQIPVV